MIDNLELIRPLLNFSEEGDFYMLYVFRRKKDQPEGERDNHQSVRTIKTYRVSNFEYLEKRYDEIKMLCEVFKARAYIHVQKQNHKDVGLAMISGIAERLKAGQIDQSHIFDHIVGQLNTYEKRWIIDIDSKEEDYLTEVSDFISSCRPAGNKIIQKTPTKNGYHLITDRFDVLEFKARFPQIDIQKKNPTLLFLPNSLW